MLNDIGLTPDPWAINSETFLNRPYGTEQEALSHVEQRGSWWEISVKCKRYITSGNALRWLKAKGLYTLWLTHYLVTLMSHKGSSAESGLECGDYQLALNYPSIYKWHQIVSYRAVHKLGNVNSNKGFK